MLTLVLLLTAQQGSVLQYTRDSVYATPHLDSLVQRAAAANGRVPDGLSSYKARVVTETSIALVAPDGRETVFEIEQIESNLYWLQHGTLIQQVLGYRSQNVFVPWYSLFGTIHVPTMVPTLYGERLDLIRTRAPRSPSAISPEAKHPVHPFSTDRDEYYRFAGGDTVQVIRVGGHDVPIVRIHAMPARKPAVATMLFNGDIDLDATSMHIVRMQGRLVLAGPDPPFNDDVVQGNYYVQFESAAYSEQFWLPREQRWEVQLAMVAFSESRVVVRAVTRFVDVQPNDTTAARVAASADSAPYGRIDGRADQKALAAFNDWHVPMGALTAHADAHDFDEYAPRGTHSRIPASTISALLPEPPHLSFGTRYFSQILRFNSIEGVYTGAGARLTFGWLAPGLTLRANAGWAWREETTRGGVEFAERRGSWEFIARGERQLAQLNNLSDGTQSDPGVPPFVGDDRFFDRRLAGVVARTVRAHGVAWRFEVARGADRVAGRNVVQYAPLQPGDSVTPVPVGDSSLTRSVFPGNYWLTRAEVHLNPSIGISLQRNLRLRLAYEGAVGTVNWRRVEVGVGLRRVTGRWTFALRGDAGTDVSNEPPPQALFQLRAVDALTSGDAPLPFTGDRAAVARSSVSFRLPILNAQIPFRRTWLPAPAPSPYVGVQYGWTGASARTQQLMQRFGWQTSDGARAALELGIHFFGGAIGVGVGHPLEAGGGWSFGLRGGIGS